MATRSKQAEGLTRSLRARAEVQASAPPTSVYDELADLAGHARWTGIDTIDAPDGPAVVGTEFVTTGPDPMGTFEDRSVVTVASRPSTLEFVTDALLTPKGGGEPVEWTLVHRYDISPESEGSRIVYTVEIQRISRFPGMLRLLKGRLAGVVMRMSASGSRRAIKELARLAGERQG